MKLRRLLPLLLLAACTGDPSGVDPGDVLVTIAVDEAAGPSEDNVQVQVRNQGDRTVYLGNICGDVAAGQVERRQGVRWVPAPIGRICFAAYTPPVPLAPGEMVSESFALREAGYYRTTVRLAERQDAALFTPVREEFEIAE